MGPGGAAQAKIGELELVQQQASDAREEMVQGLRGEGGQPWPWTGGCVDGDTGGWQSVVLSCECVQAGGVVWGWWTGCGFKLYSPAYNLRR